MVGTHRGTEELKDKADKDKVRYLQEQKAFYDEVERIGHERGTFTTKEGQVIVAHTQPQPCDLIKTSK